MRKVLSLSLLLLIGNLQISRALEIQLDYSLDTNNFFKNPGSPQRLALRAVADFFADLIDDELDEINQGTFGGNVSWSGRISHPSSGDLYVLPGLIVPKNTILIYVGARPLGSSAGRGGPGGFSATGTQAWFDRIRARGETNTDGTPSSDEGATDFGLWGGGISFDTERTWNFSLTARKSDGSWGSDFITVALHEFGHVLGIGSGSDSWETYTDNSDPDAPVFRGPFATASFGRPVPMQPGGSHWQDDGACEFPLGHDPDNPRNVLSRTLAQFGVPAGVEQIARMDPRYCATGDRFQVFTELDVAALQDVGWTLSLSTSTKPKMVIRYVGGVIYLSWPTQKGLSYQVERSNDLQTNWEPLGALRVGDGSTLQVSDRVNLSRWFYRLRIYE